MKTQGELDECNHNECDTTCTLGAKTLYYPKYVDETLNHAISVGGTSGFTTFEDAVKDAKKWDPSSKVEIVKVATEYMGII